MFTPDEIDQANQLTLLQLYLQARLSSQMSPRGREPPGVGLTSSLCVGDYSFQFYPFFNELRFLNFLNLILTNQFQCNTRELIGLCEYRHGSTL